MLVGVWRNDMAERPNRGLPARGQSQCPRDNTTRRDPCSDFGLFRLDLDLNGDGRAEVLVSSTKDRDGRQGNLWLVYEPSGDGYSQVGEGMTFSGNGFYLGQVDEINRYGLVTFNPAGGGEGHHSFCACLTARPVREIQLASISRDSPTGELREQAIIDKYVQRATKGDQLVRSIDAATLAKQYRIKIDVRTNRQAAQGLVAAPQAQGPSTALSSATVSSSDPSVILPTTR